MSLVVVGTDTEVGKTVVSAVVLNPAADSNSASPGWEKVPDTR